MTSEVLPPPPAAGGDVKMDATSSDTTPNLGSSGSPPLGSSNQNHQFTLRALVSSKEAGVIIGKAGKNVADLREATGCKAGVSKVLPGVQERVLSVTGPLEAVCKVSHFLFVIRVSPHIDVGKWHLRPQAYASILANMSENPSAQNEGFASGISSSISIKLLVANAIMGSVIGKAGATIQALQAKHSSKIVTVKEMLPNSTERIVSVEGSVSAVESTVQELARIVSEQDSNRLSNHILYQPGSSAANTSVSGGQPGGPGGFLGGGPLVAGVFNQNGSGPRRNTGPNNGVTRSAGGANASQAVPTPSNPDLRTQNISIPSDMVSIAYLELFSSIG